MAPKGKMSAEVQRIRSACKALRLDKVSPLAWKKLREAESAFSLDLEVDVSHVTVPELRELSAALAPLAQCLPEVSAELWEWLAQPISDARGKAMPCSRALISLLAQALGGSGDLMPPAASAYLALLVADGSDRQWTSLFQPAIFRQILRALRGLRRGDLKARRERGEATDEATEEDAGEEDDEGAIGTTGALELLSQVSALCRARGLSSVEAAAMAVDELATLVSKPLDDAVAREASFALAGIVARAGGADDVRRAAAAVIRATMPALMMTQERVANFQGAMPRPLQQARNTVLSLLRGLVRTHAAVLLSPRRAKPPPEAEDVEEVGEEGEQAPRKRARRRGDEESGDGEVELGATQDAAAEGGGKPRRKRPRQRAFDDPIVATLELLCVLTPDRSEWRTYAADSVITLLAEVAAVERMAAQASASSAALTRRLPGKSKDPAAEGAALPTVEDTAASQNAAGEAALVPVDAAAVPGAAAGTASVERFIAFLARLLECERVSCRVLATEVALGALERSGSLTSQCSGAAHAELVRRLLVALVRRCSDAVPTVRSRALGGVAGALTSLARCGDATRDLLRAVALERGGDRHVNLPALFRAAALDEKPTARRSALGLLDTVLPILQAQLELDAEALADFFDVGLLVSLSADESISVRKASVASVALLLRLCPVPRICELWRRNVLPLVLDAEASVAERAVDELEAAVIAPLAEQQPRPASKGAGDGKRLSLRMPVVFGGIDSEAMEYLQRGMKIVAKRNEGQLPKGFLLALGQAVKECAGPLPLREWPVAVWFMLEEAIASGSGCPGLDFDTVLDAWIQFSKLNAAGTTVGLGTNILHVLEQMIPSAPTKRMDELVGSLGSALSGHTAPPSLMRAMMSVIECVEATWKSKRLYAERAKDRAAWRVNFLKSIQASLAEAVRGDAPQGAPAAKRLEASLFALGELVLLDSSIVSEGILTQVQTIATNTVYKDGQRVELGAAVRGQAFAALGKCCLKKEALAKKSVELLVVHLNAGECFVVRNNVLIALGDLCMHYTSLVDRFVPSMTLLLRDSNELLRKQAAMTVASLLSEDFIKLRGSILLRFLYVLSDPSDAVRNFTECVFARILHQRNSSMFAQSFLDVVCALNGWSGLAQFRSAEGNEDFSLVKSPGRRVMIYRFMLTMMSSEQKFNVCAQIVTTLLAAFVDAEEAAELPRTTGEPAGQTLSDGLSLLCCKEMRICFTTQRAGQDDDDVEGAGGGGAGGAGGEKAGADAARAMLSSILKRNMCENIVPVLVQLKTLMEAKHSPFLRQLRSCLREILRDFKDDLQVMLSGDPQLAAEIAYDLQKERDGGGGCEAPPLAPAPVSCCRVAPLDQLGRSRRQSLGTMMRPPPIPIDDGAAVGADEAARPDAGAASSIPKARRSSFGGAGGRQPPAGAAPRGQRRSAAEAQLPAMATQDADEDEDWNPPKRRGGKRGKAAAEVPARGRRSPIVAAGA